MKRGSCPLTRIRPCQKCAVHDVVPKEEVPELQPQKTRKLPEPQPQKRRASKLPEPPAKGAKRSYHSRDIFSNQVPGNQVGYGKRRSMRRSVVSPVQAAVDQARALVALKRKCKGKVCHLEGSNVYKRKRRVSKRKTNKSVKRNKQRTRKYLTRR